MRFSLIIPSYNNSEELIRELPPLLDFLEKKQFTVEVVIVNDGSSQVETLKKFCTENAFVLLDYEKNLGKGAAVRAGMLSAHENVRIFTDADIPFQYSIFTDMATAFSDGNVHVVCGSRSRSDYFSRTPWYRRLGSSVFSLAVNAIMMRDLGDTQCGIKGFRSDAVEKIFPKARINGFAADIEWLYFAGKEGYDIRWVNAEFRNAGESSVVFWKQAVRMLGEVLRLRFRTLFKRDGLRHNISSE